MSRVRIDQLWLSRTPSRQDIFYSAAILGHFTSVLKLSMRTKPDSHVFWDQKFHYPRVSTGAHPLTKKPEDSGYEIGITKNSFEFLNCHTFGHFCQGFALPATGNEQ